MTTVAFAVAEAEGALSDSGAGAELFLPYLDLKDEMTSANMLWGLLFSLGGESREEVALAVALAMAAERGAAVTVVAESLICSSLRLESCSGSKSWNLWGRAIVAPCSA